MNNVNPHIVAAILPFVTKQQVARGQIEQELQQAKVARNALDTIGLWIRLTGSHDRYMIESVQDILSKRITMLEGKLTEAGGE